MAKLFVDTIPITKRVGTALPGAGDGLGEEGGESEPHGRRADVVRTSFGRHADVVTRTLEGTWDAELTAQQYAVNLLHSHPHLLTVRRREKRK